MDSAFKELSEAPPPVLDSHTRFIRRIDVLLYINQSINLQLKYAWLPFLVGKKFHQLDEKSIEKSIEKQSCSSDSWGKPKHSTTSLSDWSKKPRSDKSAAQKINTNLMIVW